MIAQLTSTVHTLYPNMFASSVRIWVLTLAILRTFASVESDLVQSCDSAEECAFETISLDSGTTVTCYGYFSCTKSTIFSAMTSENYQNSMITCGGAYSCFMATTLNGENIKALGLYSSAFVNSINIYGKGILSCIGERSCYGSKMFAYSVDGGSPIHECDGYQSCKNGIYVGNLTLVRIRGYMAADGAIFYVKSNNTRFEINGAYGGENTTIYCGSKNYCIIECEGNACNAINVGCEGSKQFYNGNTEDISQYNRENDCNIIKNCTEADPVGFCNNNSTKKFYYQESSHLKYLSMDLSNDNDNNDDSDWESIIIPNTGRNITVSNFSNSWYACDSNLRNGYRQVINCENYYDSGTIIATCVSTDADTISLLNYNTICCTAYKSCINDNQLIAGILTNNDSSMVSDGVGMGNSMVNFIPVGIRCDGGFSCNQTSSTFDGNRQSILDYNTGIEGGNLYFTGLGISTNSCNIENTDKDSRLKYWDPNAIMQTSNLYDIFCTGTSSCQCVKEIKNGQNLYCFAYYSCQNVEKISNIENIYIYGHVGGILTTFENITGNIYCGVSDACEYSTFNNIGGSILGVGLALQQTHIYNVMNSIVGVDKWALYQATIVNASQLFCEGDFSCYETRIVNVSHVYASGTDPFYGAIINTSNSGNEYLLALNGTSTMRFDYYCLSKDTCYINCETSYACSFLFLHCADYNCYVKCDTMNGIEDANGNKTQCPIMIDYVWHKWTSTAPTKAPTISPTKMPTQATKKPHKRSDDEDDSNDVTDDGLSNSKSNGNNQLSNTTIIIIVVCVSATLLCILVIMTISIMRQKKKKGKANGNNNNEKKHKCEKRNKMKMQRKGKGKEKRTKDESQTRKANDCSKDKWKELKSKMMNQTRRESFNVDSIDSVHESLIANENGL